MFGKTNAISGGVNMIGDPTSGMAIIVSYPASSTCTCTNGTKTLRSADAIGACVFYVPSAGSWTVSCTDGTNIRSKTIAVVANTAYDIVLSYATYILCDGALDSTYTINYGLYATYNGTQLDSEGVHTVNQSSASNTFYFTPAIDVTDYNKLCARANVGTAYGNYLYRIGLSPSNVTFSDSQSISVATSSSTWLTFVEQSNTNNTYVTIEVDISSITGNACIASTGLADSLTTDIWFE